MGWGVVERGRADGTQRSKNLLESGIINRCRAGMNCQAISETSSANVF
jgi:DNA-binding Lrp family transcriptional regulator